jgi:hypothetical protein
MVPAAHGPIARHSRRIVVVMRAANVDVRALVVGYRGGATLEDLALEHRVSVWTVRARLRAAGVQLRRPGRRPLSLTRFQSDPMCALTGTAGRERYERALEQGAAASRSEWARLVSQATRLTQAAGQRGSGRRPVVRTLPRAAGAGHRGARPAIDDAAAGELAQAVAAAHQSHEWQQLAASLPDDELAAGAEALTLTLAGGPGLTADTGSTRGVRPGADGRPERF